ncbi:MAG: methyltransferase domain-containing protein [Oscillospiraceae bacterium]|nr:methyltransferase domain-containing protein [Oscillospiraceae bacterium]
MTEEMSTLYAHTSALWAEAMDHSRSLPTIGEQAAYWDRTVERYEEQSAAHRSMAEFCVRALEDRGLLDCESALEIGCATGDLTRLLAARIGSVTGMDISEAMLRRAREKDAEAGLSRIRRLRGDYRELDGAERFDLVGASLVPATYSEPGLRKMIELSRKGGFFLSGCGALDHGSPVYSELGRLLLGREGQNRQDAIYPFNLLYALGKHPEIRYRRSSATERWDEETAVRDLRLYFQNVKGLPPDSDAIVAAYVRERLVDGLFPMERRTCFAVVTWID